MSQMALREQIVFLGDKISHFGFKVLCRAPIPPPRRTKGVRDCTETL